MYGEDTELALSALAIANELEFEVSLGPLGLFVRDGQGRESTAAVYGGGPDTNRPATFIVGLNAAPGQRMPMSGPFQVQTQFAAAAFANLPLYFPSETNHLTTLEFQHTDFAKLPNADSLPNLDAVKQSLSAAITDIDPGELLLSMAGGWKGVSDLILDTMAWRSARRKFAVGWRRVEGRSRLPRRCP